MSDEYIPKPRFKKRKRKHVGQDWDQSDVLRELEEGKRRGRQLCKRCGKHKPWSKLTVRYEKVRKGFIEMVWYCPDCGNAVFVREFDVRRKKKEKTQP